MAITFTAGTVSEATASVTSTTVTLPAGLQDGDYTIIAFSLNASTGVITTPAGWTDILASTQATASTSCVHAIFYRKWVSGDTDPAVTTTSGRTAATPIRVQGADPTTFVDVAATVTQAAAGATTVVAPTITPASSTLVCTFQGRHATNGGFLTPFANLSATMTAVSEASGKAAAQTNAGHQFAFEVVTPSVATGTRQSDPAVATTGAMGVSFSLNEAASGPADNYAVTSSSYHPGRRPGRPAQSRVKQTLGYTIEAASVLDHFPDDPVGITDLADDVQDLVRTNDDPVGITDNVTATLSGPNIPVNIDDTEGITDSISYTLQAGAGGGGSLAIDASSPARAVAQNTAVTSGSFTPPAGALLIAVTMADGSSDVNPTVAITNTGGGLGSWTEVERATDTTVSDNNHTVVSIHWAKVNSSAATTVTSTQTNGNLPTHLKVYVLTGANTTAPIGVHNKGGAVSASVTSTAQTTTGTNSYFLMGAADWQLDGTPTSSDLNLGQTFFLDTPGALAGGCAIKLVASPTSTTGTITNGAAAQWHYVTAEILAGGGTAAYTVYDQDPVGIRDSVTAVITGTDYSNTPADAEGITDAASDVLTADRTPADPEGITDAVALAVERTLADPEGITDTATDTLDAVRTAADPEGITDAAAALQALDRAPSDAEGITDSSTALQALARTEADPEGITDTTSAVQDTTRTSADAVGLTDTVTDEVAADRTFADAEGISETLQAAQSLDRAEADTVGLTDDFTAFLGGTVNPADTDGITDTVSFVQAQETSRADTEGITDAASTTAAADRAAGDTEGISDTSSAVQGLSRTAADTEGITDAASVLQDAARTAADTVGVTDAPSTTQAANRTPSDPVGITDSANAELRTFDQFPSDTVGLTDTAARTATADRTAADAVGLSDTVVAVASGNGSAGDTENITDAAARDFAASRTAADTLGLTDAAAGANDFVRTPADPEAITDAASFTATSARTAADAVGLTDSVQADLRTFIQNPADQVGLTDAAARDLTADRAANDPLGATDAASTALAASRLTNDPAGLSDAATAAQDAVRGPSDSAALTDAANATQANTRALADTEGLTDAATAAAANQRTGTDPVGLTDSVTAVMATVRNAADIAGITDACIPALSLPGEYADPEFITDSAAAVQAAGRTPADTEGITDSCTYVLARVLVANAADNLGMVDSCEATGIYTRIVLTGHIGLRAWTGEVGQRVWTGTVGERVWAGNVGDRAWSGEMGPRAWEGRIEP